MNLNSMSFDNGFLNLANWTGNVIMPTLAALFVMIAIIQFSKSQEFSHSLYGALACLLVSGLTRAFETFASQAAWNNPDVYWLSIVTLINWVGNVIAPVGAALAVVMAVVAYSQGRGVARWAITAGGLLAVSGLTRLIEFWVANGTQGVQ